MTPNILAALVTVVIIFCIFTFAWVFYVASMGLLPRIRAKELAKWTLPSAYLAVFVGLVLDMTVNLLASIILLDFPRDLLLTGKLKRLKRGKGWRAKVAKYICEDCLNFFDPTGYHC